MYFVARDMVVGLALGMILGPAAGLLIYFLAAGASSADGGIFAWGFGGIGVGFFAGGFVGAFFGVTQA